ncbi:MAG: DUF4139 domain-containing protein [Polyangiales bacterium]
MKRIACLFGLLALTTACGPSTTSYVKSNTTLGRVVVYRNGIAYYERHAVVDGDTLHIAVPADKLDDFLKSLTVTDAKTGEPAPISYPTTLPAGSGGIVDLEIKLGGPAPHDLKLTYVTEAPSWKPSYRVVLGDDGKLAVEGWAVIDNTSGEDWENVRLGVGSSSALSFKFDLKTVRVVARDTLQADDVFAVAPPVGGALYGGEKEHAVTELSEEAADKIALAEKKPASAPPKTDQPGSYDGDYGGPPTTKGGGYGGGGGGGKKKAAAPTMPATGAAAPAPPPVDYAFEATVQKLVTSGKSYVVEGFATDTDADKTAASLERANKMRAQLVARGVSPDRVIAVGKGLVPGKKGGVRIIEVTKPVEKPSAANEAGDPIGISHFESKTPMTVKKASSAMVSILKGKTKGEVVYLYDPESPRGNAQFAFRAIRLENPTESTLDSGPVTVFGEGKFIGEGISEPIPPHASAFIPFALDRQIVIEQNGGEKDEIARIFSIQRGVFSTEVKHTKTTKLTLHNRLPQKAKLSIRHTTPQGFDLVPHGFTVEKIGPSNVLGVELDAASKKEVEIEETTPIFKTIDLRSPGGMDIVKLYVSSHATPGPLKEQLSTIIKLQQTIGNLEQKVETLREQNVEYRARIDELHVQIVTLKAVKSGGTLMKDLEKKMMEMSDKLSKSTIALVTTQDELMMARIRFQDAVSELTLEGLDPKSPDKKG